MHLATIDVFLIQVFTKIFREFIKNAERLLDDYKNFQMISQKIRKEFERIKNLLFLSMKEQLNRFHEFQNIIKIRSNYLSDDIFSTKKINIKNAFVASIKGPILYFKIKKIINKRNFINALNNFFICKINNYNTMAFSVLTNVIHVVVIGWLRLIFQIG
ncbi:hypothetical protein BpHYR1_039539 [Brachionus plicatilis]|uniref:Uncharacterized protein n=1 Tax=Brachionus plicatilis TaxID=10195 RepID=A0A3M7SS13_BRAPC|nr:hypothetical protein BpHYR1_039539 [Brachionus plicatilis]